MGDDLLGDILRATTGESPVRPASGGPIGDVIGQAVSRPARAAAAAVPIDLAPLAALDEAGAKSFLRYLPSDLVVPLLAHAPVAVAQRMVGAMDPDARAWLGSQSDEIDAVTPDRHATAAAKAITLLVKLREDGRLTPSSLPGTPASPPAGAMAAAVPPSAKARPVQVSTAFGIEAAPAAAAAPVSAPAPASTPAADPTIDLLAALIDAAKGCRPGELRQLADGLDHPVLAQGLRLVAANAEPHDLDATLRSLASDYLAAEAQRLDLMRRAVMAIRFGDSAARFRASAGA